MVAILVTAIAWGCAAEDPVLEAATAICDAIDQEPSDVLAFEAYVRAMAQERRAGMDEAALQAAVEQRCGRALRVITAAAEQPVDDPPESETETADKPDEPPAPEPEAEVDFVDLVALDWVDQPWTTDCTSDGQSRDLDLVIEEPLGAVHRPADGALTPVFVVDVDGAVFGDITGNGQDEAIFVTQCVFANAETFLEVWSHDEQGQPLQLPLVQHFSRFEQLLDHVETVDGRLRVHTFEGAVGDSQPHINGFPIGVVTDWSFDGATWSAQEISRSEPEPPSQSVVADEPPVCEGRGSSVEATAQCLVAAVNAQDYATAATNTSDDVLSTMRSWREEWGPLNWELEGCDHVSCWFYEPSTDPQFHGVGIEMGHNVVGGTITITWLETYG